MHDKSEFKLQRIPVTMSELAEDAGHMGYNRKYYPGSSDWMKAHNKKHIKEQKMSQMEFNL